MKQWNVKGVDRATGKDRNAVVEAENKADAAKVSGLMVESVEAISVPLPPIKNTYDSVALSASIICGLGWATTGIALLIAFVIFANNPESFSNVLTAALTAIFGTVFGLFQIGFGYLIHMLRETAIHIQSK